MKSLKRLFDYRLRVVRRSENRVPVLFGGHNLPPLVEIGLIDLSKSGSAMAPPGTTGLRLAPILRVFLNEMHHPCYNVLPWHAYLVS